MSSEKNLKILLKTMSPFLDDEEYVFCSVSPDRVVSLKGKPILQFNEQEGVTLVMNRKEADANGLTFSFPSKKITLSVNSDLEAVGFLAAVTHKLADAGISVNAISAYFHDHLFVPVERADDAMRLLTEIAE